MYSSTVTRRRRLGRSCVLTSPPRSVYPWGRPNANLTSRSDARGLRLERGLRAGRGGGRGARALLELPEDVGEHGADELVVAPAVAEARGDEALAGRAQDVVDEGAVARAVDLDEGVLDGGDRPLARLV